MRCLAGSVNRGAEIGATFFRFWFPSLVGYSNYFCVGAMERARFFSSLLMLVFLGLKSMTCTKNPPFQHFNNKARHKSNPKGVQKKEKKILASI